MAEKKDETKTVPEVTYTVDEYAENPLMEHKESGKEFFTLHGNAGGYQDIEQK